MVTRELRAIALLLALSAAAPAQDLGPTRSAPDPSGSIVLESLDGTLRRRAENAPPLTSLAEAGAAFARFEGVAMAPGEESSSEVDPKDRASLELAGGDRLSAAVRGGDGDLLTVALRGGVELQLSIDGIRSVVFPARIPASVTSSPTAGEEGDRLYLVAVNGLDRAEGFVDSFEADGVRFEDARLGSRTYAWDRVAALFVSPLEDEREQEDEDRGERVSVALVGGGRISGELVEIGSPVEGVRLRLGEAADVQLPGSIVTEVALDDGSFRFLGDLEPTDRGTSSPFDDDLGFVWPMRVDRSCRGGLLQVAGVTYARGLGVHAPSELTWSLDGEWKELRFLCGVDDTGVSGARGGAVIFRVRSGDRVLWESDVVRAGSPALAPMPVPVQGVTSLVLEVDPAGDFVLDRADWLRPMLVR
ncbi:MAG: NPCBM/NEW2 domain-containing protein [Planctomycetota bacterium]